MINQSEERSNAKDAKRLHHDRYAGPNQPGGKLGKNPAAGTFVEETAKSINRLFTEQVKIERSVSRT